MTTTQQTKLPPLPKLPKPSPGYAAMGEIVYEPSEVEAYALAFGQLCREQALEDAAKTCEQSRHEPSGHQTNYDEAEEAFNAVQEAASEIRSMK